MHIINPWLNREVLVHCLIFSHIDLSPNSLFVRQYLWEFFLLHYTLHPSKTCFSNHRSLLYLSSNYLWQLNKRSEAPLFIWRSILDSLAYASYERHDVAFDMLLLTFSIFMHFMNTTGQHWVLSTRAEFVQSSSNVEWLMVILVLSWSYCSKMHGIQ